MLLGKVTERSNCALDDDSGLLLMARHVLGGPRDEGRVGFEHTALERFHSSAYSASLG
jgi:hypothetical protein